MSQNSNSFVFLDWT